jgi:hypothetical protein
MGMRVRGKATARPGKAGDPAFIKGLGLPRTGIPDTL